MVRTRSSIGANIPSLPRRLSSSSPLQLFGSPPPASNDSRPPITRNRRRYSFGVKCEDLAFDSPVTTYQEIQRDIPTCKNDQTTSLQQNYEVEKNKRKGRGIPLPPKKSSSNPKRSKKSALDKSQESNVEDSSQLHHDSKGTNDNSKKTISGDQKPSFLSGINVHSQNIDFLSLPDPPSPTAISKNLRRKRRLSSPIFRSTPLKDVTNEDSSNKGRHIQLHPAKKSRSRVLDESECDSENHTGLVQNRYPMRSRRKSRRSLCHVESPSLNKNESNAKKKTQKSESILTNKKESSDRKNDSDDISTQGKTIVLESDDEDQCSSRRSKGRRSMIIPKKFQYTANDKAEKCDSEKSTRHSEIITENTMNLQNDEISGKVSSKAKRRKRHSILLPSEQTTDCALNCLTEQSMHKEEKDSLPLNRPSEDIGSSTRDNKRRLKEFVRQFTRLPPNERILSEQSIQIERLTGYSLLTPMDRIKRDNEFTNGLSSKVSCKKSTKKISSNSTSNDFLIKKCKEEKQKLIIKMGPLVEIMEKRKKEETSLIRKETGCKVQKKRGEMHYFCLESGEQISREEYQQRYFKMIKKSHEAKKQLGSKVGSQICNEVHDNNVGENPSICRITKDAGTLEKKTVIDSTFIQEIDPYDLIPSKDEPSSDPEVAAAEQRLWSAIDEAMDVFTNEIFAISAARKAINGKIMGENSESNMKM